VQHLRWSYGELCGPNNRRQGYSVSISSALRCGEWLAALMSRTGVTAWKMYFLILPRIGGTIKVLTIGGSVTRRLACGGTIAKIEYILLATILRIIELKIGWFFSLIPFATACACHLFRPPHQFERRQDEPEDRWSVNALNTVEDTKRFLRRCTTGIYEDIAAGRLVAKKIGGSTRVTGESIIAYIEQAPARCHHDRARCTGWSPDGGAAGEAGEYNPVGHRDAREAPFQADRLKEQVKNRSVQPRHVMKPPNAPNRANRRGSGITARIQPSCGTR
jgi:hypothetical protein